jgi:hypothetical protein
MKLLTLWLVVGMDTTACGKEWLSLSAVMVNAVTRQRIQVCLNPNISLYAIPVDTHIDDTEYPLERQRVVSAVKVHFNHNMFLLLH